MGNPSYPPPGTKYTAVGSTAPADTLETIVSVALLSSLIQNESAAEATRAVVTAVKVYLLAHVDEVSPYPRERRVTAEWIERTL